MCTITDTVSYEGSYDKINCNMFQLYWCSLLLTIKNTKNISLKVENIK